MKVDYLIVGFGLAGVSFAEQLRKNNKSFVVISSLKESSSLVAGGMYNPVILKRFTLAWLADEHLEIAIPFYQELENYLKTSFLIPMPIHRIFNTIEEQNNWQIASDKPSLNPFLNHKLISNTHDYITANHKFGEVTKSGRLDVAKLLNTYIKNLSANNQFLEEQFNHSIIENHSDYSVYKNYTAKNIVFCEGYGLKANPFFNHLPLKPSKGETIVIKAELLNLTSIVKSGVFIIPIEKEHHYLVGATYNWTDDSWGNTEDGKEELIQKINKFITCSFEIVHQSAGIRPTVKDRRPLVGQHLKNKNLYILNGLGTRGVIVAPAISKQLFDFIEYTKPLDDLINIQRFHKD